MITMTCPDCGKEEVLEDMSEGEEGYLICKICKINEKASADYRPIFERDLARRIYEDEEDKDYPNPDMDEAYEITCEELYKEGLY